MSHACMRVLCLGNDILADDCFGLKVASELRAMNLDGLEIVEAATSGFDLLDYTLDTPLLVVVDTVQTGKAAPGTIYEFKEGDMLVPHGSSPHYIGLFEALAAGRKLGLAVAPKMTILAVEAFDCLTIGGGMHQAVESAISTVAGRVVEILNQARLTASD